MKKSDIVLLAGWLVIPPIILWLLHGNFFVSIFLYLVLPSVYFSIKKPEIIFRAATVSAAAMAVGAILDSIAFLNHAWMVSTIFSFRFLQLVPLEDFFFVFFAAYVIISGSHYFFPQLVPVGVNFNRLKKTGISIVLVAIVFLLLYTFDQQVLLISYYDAWLLGVAFVFPSIILLIYYPAYRKTLLWIIGFQLVAMLPYELTADALDFWTFPAGNYLGMVHLLGQRFPVEEFLEWMIFMAPAILAFNVFMAGDPTVGASAPRSKKG